MTAVEVPSLHINMGSTLTAAFGLGHDPVPLEPYRSEAFFALERERIFRRAWLVVGRIEELPDVGSFILRQLDPCGVSALVVRTKAGRIQAFHNSCAHRGSALVSEDRGRQGLFVCPYHKWSYDTEGRVVGVTDEADFLGLDKRGCGLAPIATEIWEGWVFVNLAPEVDLATFLGPFRAYLAGVAYHAMERPVAFTADLEANWKVVSDAFLESYHLPFIHPASLAGPFTSSANPFGRFLAARRLGPHHALSYYGNPEYAPSAAAGVESLAASNGDTSSPIAAARQAEMGAFLAHPAVNPTRSNHWSMDTNALFPNLHIDFGPGGLWTHQFWPLSAGRTRYEGRFYVGPASTIRERFQQEVYAARVAEVVLEDLANVARTQRGISSGGQATMQLKDSEVGIRHVLDQVHRWVGANTVAEALA